MVCRKALQYSATFAIHHQFLAARLTRSCAFHHLYRDCSSWSLRLRGCHIQSRSFRQLHGRFVEVGYFQQLDSPAQFSAFLESAVCDWHGSRRWIDLSKQHVEHAGDRDTAAGWHGRRGSIDRACGALFGNSDAWFSADSDGALSIGRVRSGAHTGCPLLPTYSMDETMTMLTQSSCINFFCCCFLACCFLQCGFLFANARYWRLSSFHRIFLLGSWDRALHFRGHDVSPRLGLPVQSPSDFARHASTGIRSCVDVAFTQLHQRRRTSFGNGCDPCLLLRHCMVLGRRAGWCP